MGQVTCETLQWGSWYNTERLRGAIGHPPPKEAGNAFYPMHEYPSTLKNAA
ncbi:hypothetical protein SAMN05216236_1605 [Sedimentitalea nanhaiensis]|uniref:Transposase n=1 Tax=Sedimentitalea nanhaiensis TaxID=999627 RepID=A0A1I7EBJ7_9RHOB|nr:hypothetical protein SAMN05216236_1605 [Sedimentitalea nanhaiensis]